MYDLTASEGLAAFILKRESREHVQVRHGSPDLCKKTTEYEKSKQVGLMEDRDEG